MQARIVKIQEAAKNREAQLHAFEEMHEKVRVDEEKKRSAERLDALMRQIPMRFRDKSFDDYVSHQEAQTKIKIIAMRYVETFSERLKEGTCMILTGKPGTGKTMLSLIIYQMLARQRYSVRYESSLDWVNKLIQQKYNSPTTFYSEVKLYEDVSFLILDEITESLSKDGSPTELERQMLFKIINKRYENSLCTLVITNRDINALNMRLGQPTADRLSENGITLAFDWDSYRQK